MIKQIFFHNETKHVRACVCVHRRDNQQKKKGILCVRRIVIDEGASEDRGMKKSKTKKIDCTCLKRRLCSSTVLKKKKGRISLITLERRKDRRKKKTKNTELEHQMFVHI